MFALPVYLANLLQQLYHAADTMILGHIRGEPAMAAVGATASLVYLIVNVSGGIASGFSVCIARAFGAGDRDDTRRYIGASALLSMAVGVAATAAFMLLSQPIFDWLHVPQATRAEAWSYIRIIYIGIPVTVMHNMAAAALRALGDSRVPSAAMFTSVALNIALDIWMISGLDMGVAGAALATVVSQAVSLSVCVFALAVKYRDVYPLRGDLRRITAGHLRQIGRIGLPYGMQFLVTALGITVVQTAVNSFGDSTIAGFSVASKLHSVFAQMHLSVGVSVMTFTARSDGAGHAEAVCGIVKKLFLVFVLIAGANMAIIGTCGRWMVRLFEPDAEDAMMNAAMTYLRTIIWFYPALSLIFLYRNVLIGLGHSRVSLIGSVSEFAIRFVVAGILASNIGYGAVCFADPAAWLGGLFPLVFLYYRKYRRSTADAPNSISKPEIWRNDKNST